MSLRYRIEPLPEVLAESFPLFLCYCLRELRLSTKPSTQQLSVADYIQNGPARSIVSAFRGLGKSTVAAIYAMWRLRLDPNERILVVSSTGVKATDFTTYCQKLMEAVDVLQCLRPPSDPRWRTSTTAFDVAPAEPEQSTSLRALGVGGSTTGQRCTCAILDDVETFANVITPLRQERVAHAVQELESIVKPDSGQLLPRKILYLGTPHTYASLYLRLERERSYERRVWPALYPSLDDLDAYENALAPNIREAVEADPSLAGTPTDPERFDEDDLIVRQASMTQANFLLQFQLDCRMATAGMYPIRLEDLVVMDLSDQALPEVVVWSKSAEFRINDLVSVGLGNDRFYYRPAYVSGWISQADTWRCVMAVDPAGRGADELAWAVVAELNGNLFVLEVGGSVAGYDETVLHHLGRVAKKWKVNTVVTETNLGAGMFTSLLKPVLLQHWACAIEEQHQSQRKELRLVDTLAPLTQQHRLVFSSQVIRDDYLSIDRDLEDTKAMTRSVAYQLSRLTTERGCLAHDDRIDALALACGFFVDAAAQDQQKAAAARQEALERASLEAWADETMASVDALALGRIPRGPGRGQGGFDLNPRRRRELVGR